ncbi:MAG: hypothetical protein A3C46_04740 [Deltaproteobacteria bacterium RIFCSPHIGHO2_02_FULL_44_16]|nr:MAG: hypothetical protein A3C46_04740 [Deltaproteobacteria bacterium RIFCSPHIGHO2_02_FULL_44_16]
MKKLHFILALVVAVFGIQYSAQAEEKYVAGGFEASGNVVSGFGWQHQMTNAHPAAAISANGDAGSTYGVLGKYNGAGAAGAVPGGKNDRFTFFVDSVELDLMKSFGENIRFRADLDFTRPVSGSGTGSAAAPQAAGQGVLGLEQAYGTFNIPAGNGIEVAIGRMDAPHGFEARDVVDNHLLSNTQLLRAGLRPVSITGGKLYYAFTDAVDFHFYISNSLVADTQKAVVDIPSGGFRLGYNWGEEGHESTFGFSAFGGPENGQKKLSRWTYAGDVDWNWWITESFAFGGEGLFRRDSKTGAAAIPHQEVFAGLLNLHYMFNDVWDGTFSGAYTEQRDIAGGGVPVLTGFEGTSAELSLGGGYAVADGARVVLEGRFDWVKNKTAGAGNAKSYDIGGALALAYDF